MSTAESSAVVTTSHGVATASMRLLGVAIVAGACWPSSSAQADERWLLRVSASVLQPVGAPQAEWFDTGAAVGLSLDRTLASYVSVGLRARAGVLSDGAAPRRTELADPGIGSITTLMLDVRVRPLARIGRGRASGLWLGGGAGVGVTGRRWRSVFDVGLGVGFRVGAVVLSPVIRYLHVLQPNDQLVPADAHLLTFGVEITLFDEPSNVEPPPPPENPDFDADGILNPRDACPRVAEDADGFEDADGCPDLDDDHDGIPDVDDACPNEPEDRDGFEDDDGCPERDNDRDGIADENDDCPLLPEVVNGVDDEDGCPDEGEIELVDDRIVLEEHVLFQFQRARVRSAARRVLDAVVRLIEQHPEWSRMRIEGHADVRGDPEYNLDLSRRRAANVMRALVRRGVSPDRLESEGYGSSRPRTTGTTAAAHQLNRRVELIVFARTVEEP